MAEAFIMGAGGTGGEPPIPPIPSHDKVFGNNTWEQISKCSYWIEDNKLSISEINETFGWNVGDTKPETISGVNYTFRILGFMHDNKVGGGKAGISLELAPTMLGTTTADRRRMNDTNTNVGGWRGCEMRTQTLPNILTQLPTDLQSVIKPVIKLASAGSQSTTILADNDILWLLSHIEVTGDSHASAAPGEGTRYAWYIANNTTSQRIKQQPAGTNWAWWLRTPSIDSISHFFIIGAGGAITASATTTLHGVSFGLCV